MSDGIPSKKTLHQVKIAQYYINNESNAKNQRRDMNIVTQKEENRKRFSVPPAIVPDATLSLCILW